MSQGRRAGGGAYRLVPDGQRLQLLVGSLEGEPERVERETAMLQELARDNRLLREMLASIQCEKLRLHEEYVALREENDRRRCEESRLREELAAVAGDAAAQAELTACIPVRLGGQVVGAIAVFRLLDHGARVCEIDRELLEQLTSQAAAALGCASPHHVGAGRAGLP